MGSAWPMEEELTADIRGRDLISGLPRTIQLTTEHVREALAEPVAAIVDAVKTTLDKTPPELAADIMEDGITITGGGALLGGLDERLAHETGHADPRRRRAALQRGHRLRPGAGEHRRDAGVDVARWRQLTVLMAPVTRHSLTRLARCVRRRPACPSRYTTLPPAGAGRSSSCCSRSVLLLTLDLRGNAVFDAARTGFSKLLEPFETAADVVTTPVRNAWQGITNYEDVAEENERLRDQLDAQRGDQVAAQAAIQDYQELLALNNLPSLGDYPTVVAMVVGESPSNLDQVIEINKGSNDGIEVGMAVIARGRPRRQGHRAGAARPGVRDAADRHPLRRRRQGRTRCAAGDDHDDGGSAGQRRDVRTRRAPRRSRPRARPPSTSIPETTDPVHDRRRRPTTTTSSTTTTTIDVTNSRETGQLRGQGADDLPQVDLLADTPVFGRFVEGDIVLTSGGTDGLAPPDIPVGIVTNVDQPLVGRGPAARGRAARRPRPAALRAHRAVQAGVGDRAADRHPSGRLMFASLVQGPLLRLFSVGLHRARPAAHDLRRPPPGRRLAAGDARPGRRRRGRRRPAEGRPRRLRARADVRPGGRARRSARRRSPWASAGSSPATCTSITDRPAVVAGGPVHRARRGGRRAGGAGDPGVHRRGARVRSPLRYRRRGRRGGRHGAQPAARPDRPLVHAHQATGVEGTEEP